MELRHLRYFVAVAEEQNVTRAAARLHLSQPPLSRQIRDLEEELGVRLFVRSAKAVRLTEAGKVFLEEARAVLNRAQSAVATVRAVSDGDRGELHVGYAPSLTVELLPLALRRFQESAPGARVTLHDLSTEAMLAGLIDKRLQIAMMIRPSAKARRGLVFDELCRYRVCVAVNPLHPFAHRKRVGLEALSAERLIAYSRSEYPEYHDWLATLFKSVGALPLVAEEHDSVTSLIASIEAGRGTAIVAECLACLAGPRVKLCPLAGKVDPFVVGLARCAGQPTELVARFMEAARPDRAPVPGLDHPRIGEGAIPVPVKPKRSKRG